MHAMFRNNINEWVAEARNQVASRIWLPRAPGRSQDLAVTDQAIAVIITET